MELSQNNEKHIAVQIRTDCSACFLPCCNMPLYADVLMRFIVRLEGSLSTVKHATPIKCIIVLITGTGMKSKSGCISHRPPFSKLYLIISPRCRSLFSSCTPPFSFSLLIQPQTPCIVQMAQTQTTIQIRNLPQKEKVSNFVRPMIQDMDFTTVT